MAPVPGRVHTRAWIETIEGLEGLMPRPVARSHAGVDRNVRRMMRRRMSTVARSHAGVDRNRYTPAEGWFAWLVARSHAGVDRNFDFLKGAAGGAVARSHAGVDRNITGGPDGLNASVARSHAGVDRNKSICVPKV
jgi:hypothetical protein